jgi:hypothetical protein
METKAAVALDDQDLELTIMALTLAYDHEWQKGNGFRAGQFRMIARKFIEEKACFQSTNIKILQEKYGINEEKPAIGVADLSGVNNQSRR